MMRAKRRIIGYVMLVASVIMLLSVVVPHHHHSNGMPCYKALTEHSHHTQSHDCGCNGHNIAIFTSLLSHIVDTDANHLFIPLHTLFDYTNTITLPTDKRLFVREQAFYIESLHDTRTDSVGGLRAPPLIAPEK